MSENGAVGFSKADRVKMVEVTLTYPKLYPGIEFKFRLKRTEEAEQKRQAQAGVIDPKRTDADWLADMLLDRPDGFKDLPAPGSAGTLQEVIRSYFKGDNEMEEMASAVYTMYRRSVLPSEFLSGL